MPNNRKERHHIVPKAYLRNFADSKQQVMVANLVSQKVYPTNIINASVLDKFYTVYTKDETGKDVAPDYYEDQMSKIEGAATIVLRKVIEGMIWPLPYKDRLTLSHFISLQFVRGQDKRDALDAITSYIAKSRIAFEGREKFLSNASSASEKKKLEKRWEELIAGTSDKRHSSTEHTLAFLPEAPNYIPSIYCRTWKLYRFDDLSLISCDNPVVVIRDENATPPTTLEEIPGIGDSKYLYYPLTRRLGILMIHPDLIDLGASTEDTTLSQNEMDNAERFQSLFNKHVIKNAHKEIYCHPDDIALFPSPLPPPPDLAVKGPTFSDWVTIGENWDEITGKKQSG